MSTFSNIFSSETTGPIEAKFYVEASWDGGTKVCSNGPGHMTKMASMPIYGKNLKKSSSPEPKGLWPWNLVCSIGYSSTTKFFQMMTLGWPWLILGKVKGQSSQSPIIGPINKVFETSAVNQFFWMLSVSSVRISIYLLDLIPKSYLEGR